MQEKLRECYIKEGVNYKVRPPPRRPRRQLPTFVATTIDPVARTALSAAAPHLCTGAGTPPSRKPSPSPQPYLSAQPQP